MKNILKGPMAEAYEYADFRWQLIRYSYDYNRDVEKMEKLYGEKVFPILMGKKDEEMFFHNMIKFLKNLFPLIAEDIDNSEYLQPKFLNGVSSHLLDGLHENEQFKDLKTILDRWDLKILINPAFEHPHWIFLESLFPVATECPTHLELSYEAASKMMGKELKPPPYTFNPDRDCEIIIDLYDKLSYSLEMVKYYIIRVRAMKGIKEPRYTKKDWPMTLQIYKSIEVDDLTHEEAAKEAYPVDFKKDDLKTKMRAKKRGEYHYKAALKIRDQSEK